MTITPTTREDPGWFTIKVSPEAKRAGALLIEAAELLETMVTREVSADDRLHLGSATLRVHGAYVQACGRAWASPERDIEAAMDAAMVELEAANPPVSVNGGIVETLGARAEVAKLDAARLGEIRPATADDVLAALDGILANIEELKLELSPSGPSVDALIAQFDAAIAEAKELNAARAAATAAEIQELRASAARRRRWSLFR